VRDKRGNCDCHGLGIRGNSPALPERAFPAPSAQLRESCCSRLFWGCNHPLVRRGSLSIATGRLSVRDAQGLRSKFGIGGGCSINVVADSIASTPKATIDVRTVSGIGVIYTCERETSNCATTAELPPMPGAGEGRQHHPQQRYPSGGKQ
jgi:hypothetical protein